MTVTKSRFVPVMSDVRSARITAENAANYYRWLQRRDRKPLPDLRNDEDLRRWHRIQFLTYRARRLLARPLIFGTAAQKEAHR